MSMKGPGLVTVNTPAQPCAGATLHLVTSCCHVCTCISHAPALFALMQPECPCEAKGSSWPHPLRCAGEDGWAGCAGSGWARSCLETQLGVGRRASQLSLGSGPLLPLWASWPSWAGWRSPAPGGGQSLYLFLSPPLTLPFNQQQCLGPRPPSAISFTPSPSVSLTPSVPPDSLCTRSLDLVSLGQVLPTPVLELC